MIFQLLVNLRATASKRQISLAGNTSGGFATRRHKRSERAVQMGVAGDVATVPTSELVLAISRALFPVYATMLHDPARSPTPVSSFCQSSPCTLSTGTGVAVVPNDLVMVVLKPTQFPESIDRSAAVHFCFAR